jgi:uncharacterized membrane protein
VGTVEETVEVEAPLETVYDAWTRFEEYPRFMQDVARVHQHDETHVRWHLCGADGEREFDAEIVEQRPYERIVWQAIAGDTHRGTVAFERVDDVLTRVTLRIEDDGPGRFERTGGRFRPHGLRGDLDRFKAMLEAARK